MSIPKIDLRFSVRCGSGTAHVTVEILTRPNRAGHVRFSVPFFGDPKSRISMLSTDIRA